MGYTLCGDKPCSIEAYPKLSRMPSRYSVKIFFKYYGYSTLIQGWDIWSKYAKYFPSRNFVFRHVPEYNTLVLINKKATRKIIEENLDLFQRYAKRNIVVDEVLQEICSPKDKNKDYLIKQHITLLGILLGYGRNNALAFTQKSYIQNLKKFDIDNSHQSLNLILNPGFVSIQNGTNEEENERIRQIFQQAKQNIKINFQKDSYLETFIYFYQN
ncbi:hypothetical protein [Candidatus Protochlamydia phocaeensis]|uniref:hypothetical protein n=1 Tax=Candidatus Protochlamydia phocaeensis TaxID=1414722 RepID=UPI001E4B26B4|nr:hypothetical protein [Candidatus Protochlamydia phocaeensis]